MTTFVPDTFNALDENIKQIMMETTEEMAKGMKKYLKKENVKNEEEYKEYCYYVAGTVGEGLTKLFEETGMQEAGTLKNAVEMGMVLQMVNIIRDVHEDFEKQERIFWPMNVVHKHVSGMQELIENPNGKGREALNDMIGITLDIIPETIEYLEAIQHENIYQFCALPQMMAIATLLKCMDNDRVLKRNVKISKMEMMTIMKQANNKKQLRAFYEKYMDKMMVKIKQMKGNLQKMMLMQKVIRVQQELKGKTTTQASSSSLLRNYST
eukprot:CAMPEP_0117427828 /NCGR_PEP_ID=MMETSP0758-20121206/7623_1 /TAXON_ID=63605 /ORGANISM="Percolomonas cosmopolitus, Strain AE-1 (ATCC 50343)" /LENGTH=266 /DNA_ID=CAMNT_0005213749 /DNA_START=498 /DNA_END=1294 /DNA_ORIENTATION=-